MTYVALTMPSKTQLKESRVLFGEAFQGWRKLNNFSQYDLNIASQELGFSFHNSQLYDMENGILNPKPKFFSKLGEFNQELGFDDFDEISSYYLRRKIENATPFPSPDDESKPATASDFFAYFIGQAPLPIYADLEEVSDSAESLDDKAIIGLINGLSSRLSPVALTLLKKTLFGNSK